ncbi:MAG: SRPBCC family protein [Acidobacteria bacterium]|nr:SRPBCC family protein [Acidobacteriota bacterium]
MDYSDSIDIAASPEVLFATISDLPSMGRLSPENTGGEWLGGATGPALGAKFKGTNARNGATWSTTARVTTYESPSRFAFNVTYGPFRVAKWEYTIEATLEGCRVIEGWTEQRNAFVRRSDKKDGFDRAQFTKESIRATLAALKKICEAPSNGS